MYDYQQTYFSILFSILTLLLAWNSTFWIKDKINRALTFIILTPIYSIMLSKFSKVTEETIIFNDDKVFEFIYYFMLDGKILLICFLYLFIPALLILLFRLIRPIYLKYKAKTPKY